MEWLFGCFGIKDFFKRKSRQFFRSVSWKKRELGVPKCRYAFLGSCKDKGKSSEKEDRDVVKEHSDVTSSVHHEPRQEAKFRKTCGPALDSQLEICKASDQQNLFSDACHNNVNWEQQLVKGSCNNSDVTEVSTFSEVTTKCCQFEKFEDTKQSEVEKKLDSSSLDISPQNETQIQASGYESPYPTPLNLVAEMLTPGTVYPSRPENVKVETIRTQFVYAVPDLFQKTFESKIVEEEATENSKILSHASQYEEVSGLMKPPPATIEEQLSYSYYSPDVGMPASGPVASPFDKKEHSRSSPIRWEVNGIPNSTTKYMEDQRVSWHATPFEARLEKVLSDDFLYPQRKIVVDMKTD